MFNCKMGKGNSPAPCGSELRYHGNPPLLASVETLALHLLFWKDFVTAQCSGSSFLGLLVRFCTPSPGRCKVTCGHKQRRNCAKGNVEIALLCPRDTEPPVPERWARRSLGSDGSEWDVLHQGLAPGAAWHTSATSSQAFSSCFSSRQLSDQSSEGCPLKCPFWQAQLCQERSEWHLLGCRWLSRVGQVLQGHLGAGGHGAGTSPALQECGGSPPHLQYYKPMRVGCWFWDNSGGGCAVMTQVHNCSWLSRLRWW